MNNIALSDYTVYNWTLKEARERAFAAKGFEYLDHLDRRFEYLDPLGRKLVGLSLASRYEGLHVIGFPRSERDGSDKRALWREEVLNRLEEQVAVGVDGDGSYRQSLEARLVKSRWWGESFRTDHRHPLPLP